MSINRAIVSGNLTRDPELRATPGGTQVLGFGVAVNDRRRNQQTGEWEDYPNFIDCTMFGNRAEALSRILRKGMKVAIEGKLRYSSWENPNGQHAPQQYAPQGYQQQYAPQQAPRAYAPQPAPQQPAPQWNAQQAYQQAPQAAPQRPQQAPQAAPQPAPPQPAPQQPAPQQPAPAQQQLDVYDEDIPF